MIRWECLEIGMMIGLVDMRVYSLHSLPVSFQCNMILISGLEMINNYSLPSLEIP